jgi:MFS transporter, DHA2 family, multidrug resistance protein
VALSTAALATIPRAQMTEATGMYNVVRQVFGSVGITVSALLLSRSAVSHHAVLAEHVTATSLPAQRFLQGAAGALRGAGDDPHTAQLGALKLMNYTLGRQAAVLAFNDVFTLIVILFLAGLPLALFLRKTRMEADTDFAPD